MSLLKRNSPRRMREKRNEPDQKRTGETKSPVLGPVVKKEPTDSPEYRAESNHQQMLDKYAYKANKPAKIEEPQQLNRAATADVEPTRTGISFNLYDLSFFCEERIYNILFIPQDIKTTSYRKITLDSIKARLDVYAEYSQEASIGAFKDNIYFYNGEILIPEEYINISGFMRKFLGVEQVHVLYETGEIILQECEYCNFWLGRVEAFFEPVAISLDRPKILDEDICLDCNLSCIFRHRQQMNN